MGCTPPDADSITMQPAPGYGDSIGGMTIAGGIMGALFHRERTGEALPLDVSLLGVGMWAMSPAIALSLQLDMPWRPGPSKSGGPGLPNPLVGTYLTQDNRFLAFSCLQGFRYWPSACRVIGREELITDERFSSHEQLAAHAAEARAILKETFASAPLSEWRERLADFEGQWAVAQDSIEVTKDVQAVANGHLGEATTADGTPFTLVTTPVQFGGVPSAPKRGPEFNEHCEEILAAIDLSEEEMIELKVAGVLA
jgi:crotonobetainyl-CoA:carnitine CoA-transferase CaiB-like acyl-CoA transferase